MRPSQLFPGSQIEREHRVSTNRLSLSLQQVIRFANPLEISVFIQQINALQACRIIGHIIFINFIIDFINF